MDKKQKIIIIVSVISLILIFTGITYAYFSTNLNTNSTSSLITHGGKLEIIHQDNTGDIIVNNIYPRQEAWATKSFTLKGTNTTDLNMNYRLGLEMISSGFNTGDLTYSLENTNADSGTPVSDKNNEPLNGTGTTWFGYGQFVTGEDEEHSYTLTIYFPDTNVNQNGLQEAQLRARVVVAEVEPGDLPTSSITLYDVNDCNTMVSLNQPLPAGVGKATPELATVNSNQTWYFEYVIENGVVNEGYIHFAITSEMAINNPGMKVGEYYLQGGVNETSLSENEQVVYKRNVDTIKEAFGTLSEDNSICRVVESWVSEYRCGDYPAFRISAKPDGSVAVAVSASFISMGSTGLACAG